MYNEPPSTKQHLLKRFSVKNLYADDILRTPVTEKREKTRSWGAGDAEDNIDNGQTVLWAFDSIVEVLKKGEGVEAGEDEEEAGAEDKNVSKLRRDHGGCYYW